MLAEELVDFERQLAAEFEQGRIKAPIHLSGGNEEQLIGIFKNVRREDWVFSTWRNHYHALLHGVPPEKLLTEIRAGRSMNLSFPEHRFYTSAIVSGILPIAVGVAESLKRMRMPRNVWCFLGDMAATTGIFHEAMMYSEGHKLPITFVVEDNGFSTNAPTHETWGVPVSFGRTWRYEYERTYPHMGIGKWVQF